MSFNCLSFTSIRWSCLFLVILLLASTNVQVLESIHLDKTINTAVKLNEYTSYQSVKLWKLEVPDLTIQVMVTAAATGQPVKCIKQHELWQDVEIYQQYGSYPVINPRNETYPDDFYLDRAQLRKVATITTNSTLNYINMPAPLPGDWYFAAYLPPKGDKKLEVSGLGPSQCSYYLALSFIKVIGNESAVETLSTNRPYNVLVGPNTMSVYRFFVHNEVWKFDVKIKNCINSDPSVHGCHIEASLRGGAIPVKFVPGTATLNCVQAPCNQTFAAPMAGTWHYITMEHSANTTVTFTLEIDTTSCVPDDLLIPENQPQDPEILKEELYGVGILMNNDTSENHTEHYTDPRVLIHRLNASGMLDINKTQTYSQSLSKNTTSNVCSLLMLSRRAFLPSDYNVQFELLNFSRHLQLKNSVLNILTFEIVPSVDIGGTLYFAAQANIQNVSQESKQNTTVIACIQRYAMPVDSENIYCHGNSKLLLNSSGVPSEVFIPYPEAGKWYLGFQAKCYSKDPNNSSQDIYEPCLDDVSVDFRLKLDKCVRGQCSNSGTCREYISGMFVYARCKCKAGWRGFGCTDGSHAMSLGIQRLQTYLLTLSNLFFIPGIVVATKRGMYSEALAYTFNMFWSTFYHACDGDRTTQYCMLQYDNLSFLDYLGSVLSFWMTLMAMSRIPDRLQCFLHMLGTLGIAFAAKYDRHALATFMVPFALGAVIMLGSWGFQCYKRKACFPSKQRIFLFIAPGIVLAAIGLCIFAFVETDDNYPYTHSVWHMTISLSIAFLLPPKKTKDTDTKTTTQPNGRPLLANPANPETDILL